MTDRQKTIALAIGVAGFLCLALGGGILFTWLVNQHQAEPRVLAASAPASAARSAEPETPAATVAGNNVLTRLVQTQAALQRAHDALGKASTNKHGGYVQKARSTIGAAQRDLASAMSFIAEHPDVRLHSDDTTAIRPATIPSFDVKADGTYTSPNLAHAITALNDALAQFTTSAGDGHLAVSDLGGIRDQILGDIDQTNQHILEAYAFAHKTPNPPPAGAIPILPEAPTTSHVTQPNLP